MKKIAAILAISFSALMASHLAHAGPHHGQGPGQRGFDKKNYRDFQPNDDGIREQRREREERGVRRLQQHRWQTGYVMPQHYRGDRYKVDYKDSNLPRPSRNQQWYKINNDYILIDSESNNIVGIQGM
ncbi:RcnB family protein [Acinetobacter sp. WZC-1]|uniref:RcnB family protein n=1 Tax=Acinetobacter sp. WZC-1 TaxID=3459034 RepID=UPI00403E2222